MTSKEVLFVEEQENEKIDLSLDIEGSLCDGDVEKKANRSICINSEQHSVDPDDFEAYSKLSLNANSSFDSERTLNKWDENTKEINFVSFISDEQDSVDSDRIDAAFELTPQSKKVSFEKTKSCKESPISSIKYVDYRGISIVSDVESSDNSSGDLDFHNKNALSRNSQFTPKKMVTSNESSKAEIDDGEKSIDSNASSVQMEKGLSAKGEDVALRHKKKVLFLTLLLGILIGIGLLSVNSYLMSTLMHNEEAIATRFNYSSTVPTIVHSTYPSVIPSIRPTKFLTIPPTELPSVTPTQYHSETPTHRPSEVHSITPTHSPSAHPSFRPTMSHTFYPSPGPSQSPSKLASDTPSKQPMQSPSSAPSLIPSQPPSNAPTKYFVESNRVPENPEIGYFNYDIDDIEYGPKEWKWVDTSLSPLREFGPDGFGPWKNHTRGIDPTENRCGLPDRTQSPKNMISTRPCRAWHEIRTRCGNYEITDSRHVKQILPHKLTIIMQRRPCLDLEKEECFRHQPPSADQPDYIGTGSSYSDLLNYDIKVPGEHTIDGEQFDAEIQMLHLHPDPYGGNLWTSIGVPVRAKMDGHNADFQLLLDEFQDLYDEHALKCEINNRPSSSPFPTQTPSSTMPSNTHSLIPSSLPSQSRINTELFSLPTSQSDIAIVEPGLPPMPTPSPSKSLGDRPFETDGDLANRRKLQSQQTPKHFDPYTRSLMPTIYFYRYNGSTTEPPCKSVTWWIMSEPVIISNAQERQLRRLLFTHVSETCQLTSVHNSQQRSTRPVFPLGDRERDGIQMCTSIDFLSDLAKGSGRGRECKCFRECRS